ncbi:MAG: hypothetical protein U0R64_08780 [Candidatus Nanopelagicales bacterium]
MGPAGLVVGIPGAISSTGLESLHACAIPVAAFSAPGPVVVTTTPGRRLTRAYPSAA